jgi:NhaP-type Na+/H+ or K+/H+ antiporter
LNGSSRVVFLFSDGVAVVLYTMMNTFCEISFSGAAVSASDIALGVVSFGTVALGGLTVGIIIGFLTALITKTTSEVRVVEPLALFGMAYLSYVVAELFHWSGIISLIGCGLVQVRPSSIYHIGMSMLYLHMYLSRQAHYSFKNISKKSYTTVKYFIKMLSATMDCIIFLFLGIALVDGQHYWHTGFVVWTVSFTLICRFVGGFDSPFSP